MKTHITKTEDVIIVSMNGHVDFETYVPLREDLAKLADQVRANETPKQIIFNFENLEFVGSSGISSFIQTLKEFNAIVPSKPRYCNVKSEFRKIIRAFDEAELFDFYENEDRAKKRHDQ